MNECLCFLDLLFLFGIDLNRLAASGEETIYIIMFLIIFCETGFVVTSVLPGDSMIFAAALAAQKQAMLNVHFIVILMTLAAFSGNVLSYFIGRCLGSKVYERNYRLLNRKRLRRIWVFFARYGVRTIVISRFIPVIRTFAPFVAGVSKMNYRCFMLFNFVGAILWVGLYAYGGYLLGTVPFVQNHLELTVLLMLVVMFIPVAYSLLIAKFWKKSGSRSRQKPTGSGLLASKFKRKL